MNFVKSYKNIFLYLFFQPTKVSKVIICVEARGGKGTKNPQQQQKTKATKNKGKPGADRGFCVKGGEIRQGGGVDGFSV